MTAKRSQRRPSGRRCHIPQLRQITSLSQRRSAATNENDGSSLRRFAPLWSEPEGEVSFLSSAAPRLSVVTSSPRAVVSDATLSLIESRFRGAIAASLDAFFLCESVRDRGGKGAIVDFKIVEL